MSSFMADEPAGPTKTIGLLAMGLNALGTISGNVNVDLSRGNVIAATLAGNVTLAFSNIAALKGQGNVAGAAPAIFIFTQNATGGYTVGWPATAKFAGGAAPVVKSAAGAQDVIGFVSDGVNLYGTTPANPNVNSLVATTFASVVSAAPYGASITPNLANGGIVTVSVSNAGAFTINNPVGAAPGMEWTLNITNASGGAMGAVTFGGAFRLGSFTAPANNKARVGSFYYDGVYHWLMGGFGGDI